jgi:bacteriocin-like protein
MLNEFDLDRDTSTTVRELTIDELDSVSGGTTFPPDVCLDDCTCCKK